MTTVNFRSPSVETSSQRANDLADRLERGAADLANFAMRLTESEWKKPIPRDGRTVGVVVHHVASMYPIEIGAAKIIAEGKPVAGLTWADVDKINADHASSYKNVTKQEALDLLRRNSADAAEAIRALSDEELDRATTNSMYEEATLTCQFMLEDHAVRHAYHHLGRIRRALKA